MALSWPSSQNSTLATPVLSLALAETGMEPETVAPGPGEVMATVGGVVAGGVPPPWASSTARGALIRPEP